MRSVQPGYRLTTPAMVRGWDRGAAGGAAGSTAPARAGAGGADALVNHQTWTRIHVTHYVGAGGGPAPTAEVPVRTGTCSAAPVEDRGADGHRRARRRSNEPTAVQPERGLGWPGSTLRWTGTTCSAASLVCPDGAGRGMQARHGWIGLKAKYHGGPGRAGPRAKMYRWRTGSAVEHWIHPCELYLAPVHALPIKGLKRDR